MGIVTSSTASSSSTTGETADLKWLGERFPYGDAELRHLYRAYQQCLHHRQHQPDPTTFLQDWTVECMKVMFLMEQEQQLKQQQNKKKGGGHTGGGSLKNIQSNDSQYFHPNNNNTKTSTEKQQHQEFLDKLVQERRTLIEIMEKHILEDGLIGNTFYQVACVVPGDVSMFHNQPTTNSELQTEAKKETVAVDEYTRKARLEQLFDGFSNMGRRGAKQALTVLFDAVWWHHQYQHKSQSSSSSVAAAETCTSTSTQKTKSIPAVAFLELGYRLALAIGYMETLQELEKQRQQTDDGDDTTSADLVPVASTQVLKQFMPQLSAPYWKATHLQDENDHDNNNNNTKLDNNKESLGPMVHSLLEKAKKRRRYGGNNGSSFLYHHSSSNQNGMPASSTGTTTTNDGKSQDNDDVNDDQMMVELEDILEWSEAVAPLFASILPTFLFHILFWGRSHPPTRTPFEFPNHLSSSHEALPSILDYRPRLFALACTSSSLLGPYYRLYTSALDGLSFNRIINALLGYSGPTLLLIRSAQGPELGAFTSHTWKETKDFYGTSDCFLFQLDPDMAVYRPTGRNPNYMYCNSQARSKGYDQQAHGIGFGGTVQQPRFFIAEQNIMEDSYVTNQDLTFENGSLLSVSSNDNNQSTTSRSSSNMSSSSTSSSSSPKQYMDIDSIEIWGVGGHDTVQQALHERGKVRELRDETIRRSRKVDKAQFLDDFRSGAIASKAFAFKDQMDGRAEDDIQERNLQQKRQYQ